MQAPPPKPRLWRLDRVREARVLEETFERSPEFDLRSYAERSSDDLLFDLDHLPERIQIGVKPFSGGLARRSRRPVTSVNECCPVVIGCMVVNVGPRVRIVQNEPGEEAGRGEDATEHSHG